MKTTIFWFRRDLRLIDNTALSNALNSSENVLPIFIFDDRILADLPQDDPRLYFIYTTLVKIDNRLKELGSSILILQGNPLEVWKKLITDHPIDKVFTNKDYEPYAIKRDQQIKDLLEENSIDFYNFKDQVIFEESEIMKGDGTPYTIYTPYKNKWLAQFSIPKEAEKLRFENLHKQTFSFPTIEEIGFEPSSIAVEPYAIDNLTDYDKTRDFPSMASTSYLGPHLRFGTVSVRQIIRKVFGINQVFVSELIWREFFMQILYHFPKVVTHNFKAKYDAIQWRNNPKEFEKWCKGETGYPLVDAGMKELNRTGYMHNRVRMVTASFLCKHLLIDWRWGEAYFAKKLLDYDLASNNGNWQWVAGTGCDAAPYFRIFNPESQLKKFDQQGKYINRWLPEFASLTYPQPMVEHKLARTRALDTYKAGIIN